MALAIDASTPAPAITTGATTTTKTLTSNAFSLPAGSVIIVAVSGSHDGNAPAQTIASITDSLGTHLTWTQLAYDHAFLAPTDDGAVAFYYAPCPAAQMSMTVTVTCGDNFNSAASPAGMILPIVFTGAATTQNGAKATRNSTAAATPSLSVTTTAAGSWVVGAVLNWDNATTPTVPTGQTTTINGNSCVALNATDGGGYWVQMQSAASGASGSVVTINDTAPANIHGQMAVAYVHVSH